MYNNQQKGRSEQESEAQPPKRKGKRKVNTAFANMKPPCQYYTFGCCKHEKAEECSFSHDQSLCVPGSIKKPCMHFLKGPCRYGKFCLYLHEKPNPEKVVEKSPFPPHEQIGTKLDVLERPNAVPKAAEVSPTIHEHSTEMTREEFHKQLQEGSTYYYGGYDDSFEAERAPSVQYSVPDFSKLVISHGHDTGQTRSHVSKPPCRFFSLGTCRFGEQCHYSHEISPGATAESISPLEQSLVRQEEEASRDLECGVCMENIVNSGKRFGILTECNHVFCLNCIKDWRQSEMSQFDKTKSNVRLCPQCRVESFMVIPSTRFVSDPERKQELLNVYKSRLSQVPCLHFKNGNGSCPFGASCLYLHATPDGTKVQAQVRVFTNEDGIMRGPRQVKLGDVLMERMQRSRGGRNHNNT